jgi:predicted extracellular nuclease
MKRLWLLIIYALLGAALAACSPTPAQPPAGSATAAAGPNAAAAAATAIPPPQAGQATVTGRLVSTSSGKPLAQTVVRMATYYKGGSAEQGSYVLDDANSPGATTDDNGAFVFAGLKAGDYVMVLGDVHTYYLIVSDEKGKVKVWNAPSAQVLDIGKLAVDFNP